MEAVTTIAQDSTGYSMLATAAIDPGELVLDEAPLLVYDTGLSNDEIRTKVLRLPEHKRLLFYKLAAGVCRASQRHTGITKTNAIDIGHGQSAVFYFLSRVNHSCIYNAVVEWNTHTRRVVMVACKRITAGEEVVISYTNPLLSTAERQHYLQKRYGFMCRCGLCARRHTERDARLARAVERIDTVETIVAAEYMDASEQDEYADPIEALELLLEGIYILQDIGLHALCHRYYHLGFLVCVAHQDYKAASVWGYHAYSAYMPGQAGMLHFDYRRYKQVPARYKLRVLREHIDDALPVPRRHIDRRR